MDWFERLTGFCEMDYAETKGRLEVAGNRLHSRINGQSYGFGDLELVSLQELRSRVNTGIGCHGKLSASVVRADVQVLHRDAEFAGALFQVASQFNLLEMTGPNVTPEDGVTRYQFDRTQGPACAIAAGAATIYRNYFAPVGGGTGQTRDRQINGLAEIGTILGEAMGRPVDSLWIMRNGYALCSAEGLDAITSYFANSYTESEYEALCGRLHIGLHRDVEVTITEGADRPLVSQAFCSALPVAYCRAVPHSSWRVFASLVLDAAYEAVLWAALLNSRRGASNIVLLTQLGGGAFGNDEEWILSAMRRAMTRASGFGLDVRVVCYGSPGRRLLELVEEFQ